MKIKLIDIKTEHVEGVQFGTCEMCMSFGSMDETDFIFQYESGRLVSVPGYQWDYGDLFEVGPIDNVASFAAYIDTLDFEEDEEMDYNLLYNIVLDYNYGLDEDQDEY